MELFGWLRRNGSEGVVAGHGTTAEEIAEDLHSGSESYRQRIEAQGGLLAAFRIDLARQLNYLKYSEERPETITLSQLVSTAFRAEIDSACGMRMVDQHFPALKEIEQIQQYAQEDMARATENFAQLPAGTVIKVAAQPGCEVPVYYADGTSDVLTWPNQAYGYVFMPQPVPDKIEEFVVGESGCELVFTDDCLPVLKDTAKSIILPSVDTTPDAVNPTRVRQYELAVILPSEHEEHYEVPAPPSFAY